MKAHNLAFYPANGRKRLRNVFGGTVKKIVFRPGDFLDLEPLGLGGGAANDPTNFLTVFPHYASCRASPDIAPPLEIATSAAIKRIRTIRENQTRTPLQNHGRPF